MKRRKKALRRDFWMEVKKSKSRFISIFFIVALGVAFYSGIQSASPDMRFSGDAYFDEDELMDLKVISTLGLTSRDLKALSEIEGVRCVEGSWFEDVVSKIEGSQKVFHVEALTETVNQLTVNEGKLPEKPEECFLDQSFAGSNGYHLGDKVHLDITDDSLLINTDYVVTGIGTCPMYLSFNRGNTNLGSGEINAFLYVTPESFDSDIYTEAYILLKDSKALTSYTEEYTSLVAEIQNRVEDIQEVCCLERYREVKAEAEEKLSDAKKELEDGKKEAEEKLSDAEKELKDARKELDDGWKEYEDGKQQLSDARKELKDGEKQLKDAKEQLEDGKKQMEDGEAQLRNGEAQLAGSIAQAANGQSQLDAAKAQLADGEAQLEDGKEKIADGWKEIQEKEKELVAGEKKLEASRKQLEDGKQQIEQGREQTKAGEEELNAGKAQLNAAKEQLDAGKEQLAAGKAEYEAGYAEFLQQEQELLNGESALGIWEETLNQNAAALAGQRQEYEAGMAEVQNGEAAVSAGKAAVNSQISQVNADLAAQTSAIQALIDSGTLSEEEVAAKQAEIAALAQAAQIQLTALDEELQGLLVQEQTLSATRSQLEAALPQIIAGEAEIDAQRQALQTKRTELEAGRQLLEAGRSQLETVKETLDASEQELIGQEAQLQNAFETMTVKEQELNQAKKMLDEKEQEILAGEVELEKGETQLQDGRAQLNAGKKEIEKNEEIVKQSEKQLEEGRQEIAANEQTLQNGWAAIAAGQAELESGRAKLEESRQTIADGEKEIQENEKKLIDGKKEIKENEEKLKDGKKELEDGEKEYEDGYQEYLDGKKEAEEEIADGEKEIADAEKKINEISEPKWYITDRTDLPEYSDYGDNADRIKNLGAVFPILFFLVAALISLTTMTRMVEEYRTQIGTMKALGYSKVDIASKYIMYAFLATVGGSILGVLIGEKLIPYIIIKAYGIMYLNIGTHIKIDYEYKYALIAAGLSCICTIGATLSSCYKALMETPASLMRPPAPKVGKRVFLERIPFIWRRLSFTWKSTVRNLFRYKKRFFMTIFGISGSMALMLLGFGLRDSIMDVAVRQYNAIQHYEAMIIKDEDADEEEQEDLLEYMSSLPEIEHFNEVRMVSLSTKYNTSNLRVYLYVPKDLNTFTQDVTLQDRVTKKQYTLTDEGVIISEKTAKLLGVSSGDTMTLIDDNEKYDVVVEEACENYMSHFIYMTPALYEKTFHKKIEYNEIVFNVIPEEKENLNEIGQKILEQPGALSISYTASLKSQLDRMLTTLGSVIWVLIISAGLLAFVVLYNLNNINITERQRELATLKVLGFYDGEVSQYVFRENILLTLIGVFAGCFMGIALHRFVIVTVEVDAVMFGRNINNISFVYSALLTCGFSAFVNFVMHQKLKKINMVESLKSVE